MSCHSSRQEAGCFLLLRSVRATQTPQWPGQCWGQMYPGLVTDAEHPVQREMVIMRWNPTLTDSSLGRKYKLSCHLLRLCRLTNNYFQKCNFTQRWIMTIFCSVLDNSLVDIPGRLMSDVFLWTLFLKKARTRRLAVLKTLQMCFSDEYCLVLA